ncbi:hypothetical protein ACFQX6_47590 [Streptosporangium lutulentum]
MALLIAIAVRGDGPRSARALTATRALTVVTGIAVLVASTGITLLIGTAARTGIRASRPPTAVSAPRSATTGRSSTGPTATPRRGIASAPSSAWPATAVVMPPDWLSCPIANS